MRHGGVVSLWSRWVFMFAVLGMSGLAVAATPEEVFAEGQRHFEQGAYAQALADFKQARRQGVAGPAIEYNLGVTEYRLRHYPEARDHFTKLLDDKEMRPLAAYNLGLVHNKLKESTAATKWMQVAYTEAKDVKLKQLAARALRQLGVEVEGAASSTTTKTLGLGYGSDSNVVDPVNPASNITDAYLDLTAGLSHKTAGGMVYDARFLTQDYSLANAYDFQYLSAGIGGEKALGRWSTSGRLAYDTSTLGGTAYQDVVGFDLYAAHAVGKGDRLRFRYGYDQISAPTRSYLAGTRQKLRADWYTGDKGSRRWMYELELNDRADSATASYSPTRNTLRYYWLTRFNENWSMRGLADLRNSVYRPVAGVTRSDQRTRLILTGVRSLTKRVDMELEYSYTQNNSTVVGYAYNRNTLALGLSAQF